MPAEPSYIHNGRAAAVATPRERGAAPGTPSRKDRMRESSAVQDPGLKDYRLGECLGKGAFGSVYKAFNWGTGEAVAIKQIKLTDLPKSELRMIESEIDLLKNLFHDNIVKYIGFVKTTECLNIILEYCENGSLYSICKAYGKFPENLVGVYMTQVLQGLQYLHDQGVIHRDIKGANILTTKDGTVKLADFGVSTSTLAGGGQDKEAQVVGTPYWMAPEIIQLSGASSASDIWSVGCTVIELLQGKPPYHNLAAMPALFAIVNDDHPPLPEGISAAARDFLMQCFQKDPNLRVTARKLLKHAWIVGCRRTDAPVSKPPANFSQAVEEVKQWNKALNSTGTSTSTLRTSIGSDTNNTTGTAGTAGTPGMSGTSGTSSRFLNGKPSKPSMPSKGPLFVTKHRRTGGTADAFKRPQAVKPSGTHQDMHLQRPALTLLEDDDNWDDDFATAISPSALQLPHLRPHDNFGGLLSSDRLKAFASINDLRSDNNNYDDDFEGEMLTIKGPNIRQFPETTTTPTQVQTAQTVQTVQTVQTIRLHQRKAQAQAQAQAQAHKFSASTPNLQLQPGLHRSKSTIERPTADGAFALALAPTRPKSPAKSNLSHRFTLPAQPSVSVMYQEQASDDDYSDLLAGNDTFFESKLVQGAKQGRQVDAPRLFHPSDLTSLPRSMQAAADVGSVVKKKPIARPCAIPDKPIKPMRRARSSIEIQKFAEDDDEDFSDVFGPEGSIVEREDSERGSEDAGLMLLSKMSGNSWLGDDDDEDDPFASMDPGWDEMDMDAQVARDRHARLARKVEELVGSLKTTEGEDTLADLSADLLVLLWENPEAKNLIISAHGLLPLLEILEPCTVKSKHHMILQLLKVVNTIILDDVEIQENLCFVGGIPIITKFAARQYSDDIRLEAAAFVRQMYQTSTLTLQMFVSAGGLNVLVEFLDEDYDSARDLVLIGVNGIWNVFELQGPTPKNDFCRIFSRSKILYPLALVLHRVLDEEGGDELGELVQGRIVNIFYLFSQAENYVKEVVADRQVLKSVLKDLRRMTAVHQITMLKFIKNLSMLSTTIESLHSADAIEFLIDLLSFSMKKDQKHLREISNQVLNTLFNLCRLSKERQEDAAVGGIIPLLLRIMKTDRPPKEFALPILCDMAHSGSKGRRYLWQNKGLDFYVSLLSDQYWQVTALDAILIWLQEETANVEGHLMDNSFTRAIISCFSTNRLNAFDFNLLEPLLKLLRLSPGLTASLAKPEMFAGIAQRLGHKKAVVRLNLLRLVRNIVDSCDASLLGGGDGARTLNHAQVRSLMEAIQLLAEADSAVLVRNLASELVKSHPAGNGKMAMKASASISASAQSGTASALRRNTSSYTPPKMQQQASTPSIPQTPTHASKASVTSLASVIGTGSNYIEVATASPRPRHFLPDREREREMGMGMGMGMGMSGYPVLYRPQSRDGPTGIPRRVSEDTCSLSLVSSVSSGGSGSGSGTSTSGLVYSAKSRLPRTSVANLPLGGPRRNPTPPMLVRGDVGVGVGFKEGFKEGGMRPSSSRGISMRESSVNVLSGLRRSHSRHIGEKRTQAR